MNITQARQIMRLKDNLASIRKIAGWTGEELGRMIGVTRQAISKLEKRELEGSTQMTMAQYIAIRHMFDYQMDVCPENEALLMAVSMMLDCDEVMGGLYNQLKECIDTIASAAASGAEGAVLSVIAKVIVKDCLQRMCMDSEILKNLQNTVDEPKRISWTELMIENLKERK